MAGSIRGDVIDAMRPVLKEMSRFNARYVKRSEHIAVYNKYIDGLQRIELLRNSALKQAGKLGAALTRCGQLEAELRRAQGRNVQLAFKCEGDAQAAYWMGMKTGASIVLGINCLIALVAVGLVA